MLHSSIFSLRHSKLFVSVQKLNNYVRHFSKFLMELCLPINTSYLKFPFFHLHLVCCILHLACVSNSECIRLLSNSSYRLCTLLLFITTLPGRVLTGTFLIFICNVVLCTFLSFLVTSKYSTLHDFSLLRFLTVKISNYHNFLV